MNARDELRAKLSADAERIRTTGAYTLDEIDQLREKARRRYHLNSNLQVAELEEHVRTMMFGRIVPWKILA
jgi:hypothetical protein